MAASERLLDVWIVDLQKVYTSVPFTVVTDWLQQGRLLANDRVRLAGKAKWHPIDSVPALVPYVPKKQALAIDDSAEALAQIDLGLESPKLHEEEDDDVDMIPLIDVSLVLLIFFMMTTAVSMGVFSSIPTPPAKHQLQSISGEMFWVGIEIDPKSKDVLFSLGKDSQQQYLVKPTDNGVEILGALTKELQDADGEIKVRLRADKSLPIETIKAVTLDLQELEASLNRGRGADKRRLQIVVLGEVSEPTK